MKKLSIGKKITIIVIICISLLALLIYRLFFSMNALPKGRYDFSSSSPYGKYQINVYISETSLSAAAERCEVENLNNGRKLNIFRESYDFRNDD